MASDIACSFAYQESTGTEELGMGEYLKYVCMEYGVRECESSVWGRVWCLQTGQMVDSGVHRVEV